MQASLSEARRTRNAVLRSKKRVWTISDFKTKRPAAVLRELSRLVEAGYLLRPSKGIYVRPVLTLLGPSSLSAEEIVRFKASRKGREVTPSGYSVFNTLGITTQVSGISELAVDKPVRPAGQKKSKVRFVVRDRASLSNPLDRAILEALRRINHIADTTPREVIDVVKRTIRSNSNFDRLVRLALRSEPPRVRALLGAIGEELGITAEGIERLRKSLNPTTTFRIPLGDSLRTAGSWAIRD
jgi:hypothetical protein